MYTIYHIINTINKDDYIGFTTESPPTNRWREHQRVATKGSKLHFHCAIRKYGAQAFVWTILEEGTDSELGKNIREPHWISVLKPKYNKTQGGDGVLGHRHSNITKALMSKKRKGTLHSKEHNQAVSAAKLGKSYPKQIDSLSRDWTVISPSGETKSIHNLSKFCRENNLFPGAMSRVSRGLRRHHKGWLCRESIPSHI